MSSLLVGLVVVGISMTAASLAVLMSRRFNFLRTLEEDVVFVIDIHRIIAVTYSVFLAFTIVITWGHFQNAERTVTQEVTRLSELWRDGEVFPDTTRRLLQCRLYTYATEVVETDWPSIAQNGTHSPEATAAYERIWEVYYAFEPDSLNPNQMAFFQQSIGQLNEMGRERRQRELVADSGVEPLISAFLIGGGAIVVLFSLLIPVRSARLQVSVTALFAALIAFSIFLALALQRPFSEIGPTVSPDAFVNIAASFEARVTVPPCAGVPG